MMCPDCGSSTRRVALLFSEVDHCDRCEEQGRPATRTREEVTEELPSDWSVVGSTRDTLGAEWELRRYADTGAERWVQLTN